MDDEDRDYMFNWLRDVGEAFLKERQRDCGFHSRRGPPDPGVPDKGRRSCGGAAH